MLSMIYEYIPLAALLAESISSLLPDESIRDSVYQDMCTTSSGVPEPEKSSTLYDEMVGNDGLT